MKATKKNILKTASLYKTANLAENTAYYYHADANTPMKIGSIAFTYKWNTSTGNLQLQFVKKLPDRVKIFINNKLNYVFTPKEYAENIKLKSYKSGKMILLASYDDNSLEACGINVFRTSQ
jgi:hypothetical protein